jgi:hypothetical protein
MKSSRIEINPSSDKRQEGQKGSINSMAISKLIARNFGKLSQIPFLNRSPFFSMINCMVWNINKKWTHPIKSNL